MELWPFCAMFFFVRDSTSKAPQGPTGVGMGSDARGHFKPWRPRLSRASLAIEDENCDVAHGRSGTLTCLRHKILQIPAGNCHHVLHWGNSMSEPVRRPKSVGRNPALRISNLRIWSTWLYQIGTLVARFVEHCCSP